MPDDSEPHDPATCPDCQEVAAVRDEMLAAMRRIANGRRGFVIACASIHALSGLLVNCCEKGAESGALMAAASSLVNQAIAITAGDATVGTVH